MKSSIYSTAAGMLTSVERLNILANNIANINTTGFKGDIPFEKVIKFLSEGPFPGKDQPVIGGNRINLAQGNIKMTERDLDLAFEGNGFFTIQGPDNSILYTRNGAFNLNSENELITAEGLNVLDKFDKKIKFYGNSFYFTPKGDLIVDDNYFASIKIVDINDSSNFEKVGQNFLKQKDKGTPPPELNNPNLVVGALESTNVDLMSEMASLISVQRAFGFQQRALDTILSQILKKTVTDIPRPL